MKYAWVIFIFLLPAGCSEDDTIRPIDIPETGVDMAYVYHSDIKEIEITRFNAAYHPSPRPPVLLKFQYSANDLLLRITNGVQLEYDLCFEYDEMNRLKNIGTCGNNGITSPECTIEYNGTSGDISKFYYPAMLEYNGGYYEVRYDEQDRINEVREHIPNPPTPVSHLGIWAYSYDDNDNLIIIREWRLKRATGEVRLEKEVFFSYDRSKKHLGFYPTEHNDQFEYEYLIFRHNIPGRNFRLLNMHPDWEAEYRFDQKDRLIYLEMTGPDGSFERANITYR